VGDNFTPEQAEFLRGFADHYRYGRRFMCGIVHVVAFLGAAGGAVTAYFTLWYRH
jgi:hypothetical protein